MDSLPPPSNELYLGYPLGSCHPSSLICPVLVHPPGILYLDFVHYWSYSYPLRTNSCLQSGGYLRALDFFDSC